jgi:hypothetical protein
VPGEAAAGDDGVMGRSAARAGTAAEGPRFTREELRASTPSWYRWGLHAVLIGGFCLTGIVVVLLQLERPRLSDGLFFAGMLVFTNFGEWALHRRVLHRRAFPYAAYHRHTCHHAFFGYDTMAIDHPSDFRWVMFPPWALPAMVAGVLPVSFAVRAVAGANRAWLFLLGVIVYYGVYEVFHALAHLPESHPIAGNPIVRAITRHHRVHHDPSLMRRWNFNFAIPIFDRLFGTLYRAGGAD